MMLPRIMILSLLYMIIVIIITDVVVIMIIQHTFDNGKSSIKLFLRVMQIKGKLLLRVKTGYKMRKFAKIPTELSPKFNE